jgi:hypothetical protein
MRGPINRVRDFFGAIGDRIAVDGGDLARRIGDGVAYSLERLKAPFERIAWPLQHRVIWPVQDRMPDLGGMGRTLAAGAALAVAAAIGVAGVLLAGSGDSGVTTTTEATVAAAPTAKVAPSPPKEPPAPTLQGAAPVFKPAPKKSQPSPAAAPKHAEATPAEPAGTTSSPSSAATDRISSKPAEPSAKTSTAPPAPAGPAAIAVAEEFADAFVVYETGGVEPAVRNAFGKTATEQLSRALLRRPPRLPANVEVPEAKVMNVVAAPSQGPIYPVSVSLLRLGVTSELRLSMEQRKNDEWRVTDVLG